MDNINYFLDISQPLKPKTLILAQWAHEQSNKGNMNELHMGSEAWISTH